MRWLHSFLHRRESERKLDSELRFHLEQQIRENIASGMSPEQARREAAIEFGGLEQIKEDCRDQRGNAWFVEIGQDIRYGIRQLRQNPGFTAVAVLSVAIGIGVTTAIFSLVNEVLLKEIPVNDPEALVIFKWISPPGGNHVVHNIFRDDSFSLLTWNRFHESHQESCEVFAFGLLFNPNLKIEGRAEIVDQGQLVCACCFRAPSRASCRRPHDSDDQERTRHQGDK